MNQIAGYQGTFVFSDNIEIVDINAGVLQDGNFGTRYLSEGLLTTSWNGTADEEEVLFSLTLRAKSNVQLSEALKLSSRITRSEAYSKQGEQLNLAINYHNGKIDQVGFELFQNQPNPFLGQTQIGYYLPEAASVTLTLSDVSGRTLKVIRTAGVKGHNLIVIEARDLPLKGLVYYTLATEKNTATRKMIVE